jgi:lactate dehydrogenase-like 2-hydroxyacid dehydrogenase
MPVIPRNRAILLVDDIKKETRIQIIKAAIPELKVEKRVRDAAIIIAVWSRIEPRRLPSLRFLINRRTGDDHLDKELFSFYDVRVLQILKYCTEEVAQHCFNIIMRRMTSPLVVTIAGMGLLMMWKSSGEC